MARRVQTEAGAKYYGVPIGHLITPDQEDDAVARHGGRGAPNGSLIGSNQKRAGQETGQKAAQNGVRSNPNAGNTTKAPADKSGQRQLQAPTLSGPVEVFAGKKKFNVPEGSEVFQSPQKPGRVYVVTPDGAGHVLTSSGQLALTPEQSQSLGPQIKSTLSKVKAKTEEDSEEITWTRLVSLARQMIQAEESGDTSAAKKLLQQFREAANQYTPGKDSREVRTRVEEAMGVK